MPYEWENADEAMKILDDANMPYGVLAGNHDIAAGAMEYENYQKYFGAQRVQDQPNTGSTSTAAVSQGAAQTAGKGSTPAAATAAIPQTGDTMPIVAVVLLCLGSMTALGILTIYRRKRKED